MPLSSLLLPLLLAVAADSAKHGDAPPPPPFPPELSSGNHSDLRSAICQRPSLIPVIEMARRIPPRENPHIEVVLTLDYEADGAITDVTVKRASDVPELDAALVEWSRQVRLCPGERAGKGMLPFLISLD